MRIVAHGASTGTAVYSCMHCATSKLNVEVSRHSLHVVTSSQLTPER